MRQGERIDLVTELRLCIAYLKGEKLQVIAERYKLAPSTVGLALKRQGIKARSSPINLETQNKICSAYKNRIPAAKIAVETGCSVNTILRIVASNGIVRKLSDPELVDRICSSYRNGDTIKKIKEREKIDANTVRRIIENNGIQIRSGRVERNVKDAITERYAQGMTAGEAGKPFGVSRNTVMKIVSAKQITKRSRSKSKGACQGIVYFIQCTASRNIKIGWTTNVQSRMKHMQSNSGSQLELLGYFPATDTDESSLHNEFKSFHVNGEWFCETPEILTKIELLCCKQDLDKVPTKVKLAMPPQRTSLNVLDSPSKNQKAFPFL